MSKIKCTPGPWEMDSETVWDEDLPHDVDPERQTGDYEIFSIVDTGSGTEDACIIANVNGQIGEGETNARILRASLEMLAALEEIADEPHHDTCKEAVLGHLGWTCDCHRSIAREAIAKAKGEAQ